MLPLFSLLLGIPALAAGAAGDRLQLHDPTFYPVLEKGTRMECRYLTQGEFGLVLERGKGDQVHVTMISHGVSEGESTAFDATIQSSGLQGKYLRFQKREGEFGTYIEVVVDSRVSAEIGYRLPGRIMQTSAIFEKNPDGTEKENLMADGMHRLGCRAPVLGR